MFNFLKHPFAKTPATVAAAAPPTPDASDAVCCEPILGDVCGILKLELLEARNVSAMDITGTSDPFVVVGFGLRVYRSMTCARSVNPVWKQSVVFLIDENEMTFKLKLHVYDEDVVGSNEFMGSCEVPLESCDAWIPLHNAKGAPAGEIHVRLTISGRPQVEALYWNWVFKLFDTDENGFLDKQELTSMLHHLMCYDLLPVLEEELQRDADGRFDAAEFYAFMTSKGVKMSEVPEELKGLADVFAHADVDPKNVLWHIGLMMLTNSSAFHQSEGSDMSPVLSVSNAVSIEAAACRSKSGLTEETLAKDKTTTIFVQDRVTGELVQEKIPLYVQVGMRVTYGFARLTDGQSLRAKSMIRSMTLSAKAKYENPKSSHDIPAFIVYHNINFAEAVRPNPGAPDGGFSNFNEFFYRKLVPGARPLAVGSGMALSNSDARVLVFEHVNDATRLWIKGTAFCLPRLLHNADLAAEFADCSLIINRLAPQDYHRFHVSVSGTVVSATPVPGDFYTVNPVAIRSAIDVFGENTRMVVVTDTADFGRVVYVMVGATMVGSINMTKSVGDTITAGDDFGYFAFGGSTVITLYKKGSVRFDADLLANSAKPLETLARMGQRIGTVKTKA